MTLPRQHSPNDDMIEHYHHAQTDFHQQYIMQQQSEENKTPIVPVLPCYFEDPPQHQPISYTYQPHPSYDQNYRSTNEETQPVVVDVNNATTIVENNVMYNTQPMNTSPHRFHSDPLPVATSINYPNVQFVQEVTTERPTPFNITTVFNWFKNNILFTIFTSLDILMICLSMILVITNSPAHLTKCALGILLPILIGKRRKLLTSFVLGGLLIDLIGTTLYVWHVIDASDGWTPLVVIVTVMQFSIGIFGCVLLFRIRHKHPRSTPVDLEMNEEEYRRNSLSTNP